MRESAVRETSNAPIGRRERRKLEVRSRIYAAARELFAKQGFEQTTVDEIAHVADVAPATFFNHFQTKQALITLMTGEVIDHLHALTVESYVKFFTDGYYIAVLLRTIRVALLTTVICLLMGFPLAYVLARTQTRFKSLLGLSADDSTTSTAPAASITKDNETD